MFEKGGEIVQAWQTIENPAMRDRYRQELTRLIGHEAVGFVEGRGHSWVFRTQETSSGKLELRSTYETGDWMVSVRSWVIGLDETNKDLVVGLFKGGTTVPIADQLAYPVKEGAEVSFRFIKDKETYEKTFISVNPELSPGVGVFLRELKEFIAKIRGNVFLYPTDQRRLELYKRFFLKSGKYNPDFKGTYFLFKPMALDKKI